MEYAAVAAARAERERRARERERTTYERTQQEAALRLLRVLRRWSHQQRWAARERAVFDANVKTFTAEGVTVADWVHNMSVFLIWFDVRRNAADGERLSTLAKQLCAAATTTLPAKAGAMPLGRILIQGGRMAQQLYSRILVLCTKALVAAAAQPNATISARPELRLLTIALRPEMYADAPRPQMTTVCVALLHKLYRGDTNDQQQGDFDFVADLGRLLSHVVFQSLPILGTTRTASLADQPPPTAVKLQVSVITTLLLLPFDTGASTFEGTASLAKAAVAPLIIHLLTVPLLLSRLMPDVATIVLTRTIFLQSVMKELSSSPQLAKVVTSARPGNETLFIISNLVSFFAQATHQTPLPPDSRGNFVNSVIALLWQCRSYVARQNSNMVSHHLLFEWYSGPSDAQHSKALPGVAKQISQLWSAGMLRDLFTSTTAASTDASSTALTNTSKGAIFTLRSVELMHAARLFLCVLDTMPALRRDVMSALAYLPGFLPQLWRDMVQLGPTGNFAVFLDAAERPFAEPLMPLLHLFCVAGRHLFEVLDLQEMYDRQEPFRLDELAVMASHLQHFMFRSLSANATASNINEVDQTLWSLLGPMRAILRILYERDQARPFCPPSTWQISAASTSGYKNALFRGENAPILILRVLPSALPFKTRLQLLQKTIEERKEVERTTVTGHGPRGVMIKLHRLTLIDDALKTFGQLTRDQLQGLVRVQFINQHGLVEAGIDQTGVFKEFLEESCKLLLHPSHQLFVLTPDQQIFPAPCRENNASKDNVLQMFDLLGRLLGKAVREGIVLDTPLSAVFLAKLQRSQSPLSDLSQLDPDLYKNLLFVKHYPGNIEDLSLTFSVDEEITRSDGTKVIKSRDLQPGGSAIPVNNDNRIAYVYLRADDRLNKQVAMQTRAFVHGFSMAVDEQWVRCFSPNELRRIISGDDSDLDVEDLKRHAQYAGGYHANHRVIQWLWQTVKEMSREDQKLFLRYVTSCSKPPLSGFKSLSPPFTIRSVDTDRPDNLEGPGVLGGGSICPEHVSTGRSCPTLEQDQWLPFLAWALAPMILTVYRRLRRASTC